MIAALLLAFNVPPIRYLAVDGLLISTFQGNVWHKVDHLTNRKVSLHFTEFGIGKTSGTWDAAGIKQQEPNNELYVDSPGDAPRGAIYSGPVKISRPVKTLVNSNPVYIGALKSFLRSRGITSAPRITRVVSADLDGDGTQEILIEAASRDDLLQQGMHGHRNGDYSVLLLRYLRNGKVVDAPLSFNGPKGDDELNFMNKLVAIADLDGDGTMEIVTSSDYYEGGTAMLFRYRRGKVAKLAQHGDGV